MDNKLTRTIIALEQDGLETRAMALNFLVQSKGFNLRAAIAAAASEFCQSETGQKVYVGNCHCFNWGDFDTYVPSELCEKYGFTKVSAEAADEVVMFNEQLVDEKTIIREKDGVRGLRYLFPPIDGTHYIWNHTVQWLTPEECKQCIQDIPGLIVHNSMPEALQDDRILKKELVKDAREH